MTDTTNTHGSLIELTADIASAYVGNNSVSATELPSLIKGIFGALSGTGKQAPEPVDETQTPAVSIRKSLGDDFLICLEDGRKFKSLKRHLRSKYNLTPDEYRAKWGLPKSYPMVAPAYAAARSALAKQAGLGHARRVAATGKQVAKAVTKKGAPKR